MNSRERRKSWVRVYSHELSRRRDFLLKHGEKEYILVFSANLKCLKESCSSGCIWVPATHIWIHDQARGGYNIAGHYRRAFREALPYSIDDVMHIPQICWNCCRTREKEIVLSKVTKKTLAQQLVADEGRKKKTYSKKKVVQDAKAITSITDIFHL